MVEGLFVCFFFPSASPFYGTLRQAGRLKANSSTSMQLLQCQFGMGGVADQTAAINRSNLSSESLDLWDRVLNQCSHCYQKPDNLLLSQHTLVGFGGGPIFAKSYLIERKRETEEERHFRWH